MQLSGKIALVTGAAHRVGRLIALELAQAGAQIIVHYHRAEAQAQATVTDIEALGQKALAISADLATIEGVITLFEQITATWGRVDVLVNSASIMERGNILSLTTAEWQRSLDTNLTGPFLCAQHAARLMFAHPAEGPERGVIINLADVAGLQPWATYPAHSVSKAGLVMLTKVLAKALAPHIRVNAIAPGLVLKPEGLDETQWQALEQRTLLKRAGSGYDVARAVRFLVEQDYITGEVLVMDGGRLIA